MFFRKNHSGQVALIMVLIMTVVSAVAVSLASRTTVETRIQELNVENKEAILTAQAGLEEAISKNTAVTGNLGEGQNYEVTISDTGINGITSDVIGAGETFEVNLTGISGVTGIKIYWKSATVAGVSSIFVSDVRTNQIVDYAFDTTGTYGFTQVSTGGSLSGVNYSHVTPSPITLAPESTHLRITVLGSPAYLGIEPLGGSLPPQNTEFRSVADLSYGESKVRYGIEYSESKTNQIPSIFDYALFSGGSIVQ